jgi:hypothetical protein
MIEFMNATQSPLELLLSELSTLDAELKASSDEFKAADDAYDRAEPSLRAKADPRIERYSEPDRAAILRENARELLRRMGDFSETRTQAWEKMAALRVQLNANAVASLRKATSDIAAAASAPGVPTRPTASAQDLLKKLTSVQARQVLLASRMVLAGRKVIDAQRLAARLTELRQQRIEGYLGQAASNGSKILKAAGDLLKDEARDEALKQLIEASAKVAGVAAEQAAPILKVLTVSYSLYKKVHDMQPYTPKGDIDDVLNLLTEVRQDDQTNEGMLHLLTSLEEALAVSIP